MKTRTLPLPPLHQREILRQALSGRIALLQRFADAQKPTYELTAAAALFARSIAGFLGIGLRKGKLGADRDHFEQLPGASWEVKITDIAEGRFINIGSLTPQERTILEEGLHEVNTAFAHITFWADPNNQAPDGAPILGYAERQQERLKRLAATVVALFKVATNDLSV